MNHGLGGVEKSLSGGLDVFKLATYIYICEMCLSWFDCTRAKREVRWVECLRGAQRLGFRMYLLLLLKKSVVKEWLGTDTSLCFPVKRIQDAVCLEANLEHST